jgi:hypothetical protein
MVLSFHGLIKFRQAKTPKVSNNFSKFYQIITKVSNKGFGFVLPGGKLLKNQAFIG